MKTSTVSAPGKLMLLGEHAVVYGRPCIVTAIDQRMRVTVEQTDKNTLVIDAPDVHIFGYEKPIDTLGSGDIPRGAIFVEHAVQAFYAKFSCTGGVHVSVSSEFSSQVGFGSSSASTVCVVQALAQIHQKKILPKQMFTIAFQGVLNVQGGGSGFDIAAAIYGGTIYYVANAKIVEPLSFSTMPLIVGYTGIKADTSSLLREVAEKMKAQPEKVNRIYDAIAKLANDAKIKMIEGDWERVGKLMDFNQDYLRDLGVSSQKLETLIVAAKQAGAWGAKLSGAGGGDCMIALAPDDKKKAIESAIEAVGGQVIHIAPGAQGVRIEA